MQKATSTTTTTVASKLVPKVITIPMLDDNTGYLLINPSNSKALAIDPVEPQKVIQTAKSHNADIIGILTTHGHWDHAGGNGQLSKITGCRIFASEHSKIPKTDPLKDFQVIDPLDGYPIKCYYVPFHTRDHMYYHVMDPTINSNVNSISEASTSTSALFTGDCIFVGGCGKFFDGTPKEAFYAFNLFRSFPDSTMVYTGHDYGLSNSKFGLKVEPDNPDIKALNNNANKNSATLLFNISSVAEEKKHNPFLRWDNPIVQKFTSETDPIKVVGTLRKIKDGS